MVARLRSAPNLLIAELWAGWLSAHGVAASVQSRYANGAMGELPVNECAPTIWIDDDAQAARAAQLLDALQAPSGAAWRCPNCGENVDAGFGECWNCGTRQL
ncbi:MAG: DUF2007 domain-containing protein [Betaproteobacteria bacterium]|nr:DUF2007 domain-containing protein [Betaproteobacteria bacterium]